MKLKLLAIGLAAATFLAAPAFASSSPPTETLDLRPVATCAIAKAAAIETNLSNITLTNYMGAKDTTVEMTKATSGPPGWSAGITKLDARSGKALVLTRSGGEIYGISVGLSPRPGDSTSKYIGSADDATDTAKVLLAAAPPANGFAREDLLGTGGDMGKSALAVDGA